MCEKGTDYLEMAAEAMITLDVGVWVITDFDSYFAVDTQAEILEMWSGSDYVEDDTPEAFAYLKLNGLVNQLLGLMDPPMQGKEGEVLKEMRSRVGARSPEEFEVLQAIRGGSYRTIQIVGRRGGTEVIKQTKNERTRKRLESLLRKGGFSRLIITRPNGQTLELAPTWGATFEESTAP